MGKAHHNQKKAAKPKSETKELATHHSHHDLKHKIYTKEPRIGKHQNMENRITKTNPRSPGALKDRLTCSTKIRLLHQ
jgi:hypothetical protein